MDRVQNPAECHRDSLELPLLRHSLSFIAVNTLDIVMTLALLAQGFAEGNPIANLVIERWGLEGMIAFKFSSVLVVCLISQIIATTRPDTARQVLKLCTAVVLMVVVYSMVLYTAPLSVIFNSLDL